MAVKWSKDIAVYVGTFDLTTASTQVAVEMVAPALDKTVFAQTAETAIADIRKDTMQWSGWFEDSTLGIDKALGSLMGTNSGVVSVIVGTATGGRTYYGTSFVAGFKVGGRVGELVRVEGNLKPDAVWAPAIHYGVKKTWNNGDNSGSLDYGTLTTGTHTIIVNQFVVDGGTFVYSLQDSSDGTTFATQSGATMGALNSTVITFTGTVQRYTRFSIGRVVGTGNGTISDAFYAFKRGGT